MRFAWFFVVTGLLWGCADDPLELPLAPEAERGPVIDAIFPTSAHAGQRVRVTGRNLVSPDVRLFVGTAGPLDPLTRVDDGTSLVVLVPDDATTGAISVETGGGRALSPTFTFLGPGRPLQARLTHELDLRPDIKALDGTGDGLPVVRLEFDGGAKMETVWAELASDGTPRPLPWTGVLGAWMAPDRSFALTARRDGNKWILERRSWPTGETEQALELRDPAVTLVDYDEPRVVADPTGRFIVVSGAVGTFLVERRDGVMVKLRAVGVFGEPIMPPDGVWLGGGRFAIEQRSGVALIDVATPDVNPRLLKPEPTLPFLRSLSLSMGGPGELAVASSDFAAIRFFRIPAADAPLVPEGFVRLDDIAMPAGPFVSHVAVSAEGDRVSFSSAGRLFVYDRDPAVGPLSAVDVTFVGSLDTVGRTFRYSNGRELVTLAAHTGSYLGRMETRGAWTPPLLGYRTCPDDLAPTLYVEAISKTLRVSRLFNAETLNSTGCGAIRLPALGDVIAAVRHPWRDERYVLSERPGGGALLERHGARGEVTGRVSFPEFERDCVSESLPVCRAASQLVLSDDGSRLVVYWSFRDFQDEATVLSALETDANWDAPYTPPLMEFPAIPLGFLLTHDRLVLTDFEVYAVDLPELLQGRASLSWIAPEEASAAPLGMVVAGDALSGGRAFVSSSGVGGKAALLSLVDGSLLARYPNFNAGAALFMSPGRRAAYWYRTRGTQGVEFGVSTFDPDGALLATTLVGPLPVPESAAFIEGGGKALRMEFSPDGARAYVGGSMVESILVLE